MRPGTEPLTNPRSERVRSVARLSGRSAAGRSARGRAGRFVAEGPQAVREALAAHAEDGGAVLDLYVTVDAAQRHEALVAEAARAGVRTTSVSDAVMVALLGDDGATTPQGLLAVCRERAAGVEVLLDASPRLLAVLARVRDPGNAGTVVRVADAAGADGVVLTEASTDPFSTRAVRASAGSVFHLPVAPGARLADVVERLRAGGAVVLAADGGGDVDLDDLLDAVEDGDPAALLARPTAWVLGNEAWGLPDEDAALADAVVRVPVHGRAESLNLATAATACLYASARAHRGRRRPR